MKHKNKALLPAFWKAGLRHSIKQHIIKTHFERKITSSILPQIARAIFQRPTIMEIMKRQFHPWVELGRPSAMPALCFIMLGCKHWDTGLQVVDTSPRCIVMLAIAPNSPQLREQNKTPLVCEMTEALSSLCLWPAAPYLLYFQTKWDLLSFKIKWDLFSFKPNETFFLSVLFYYTRSIKDKALH